MRCFRLDWLQFSVSKVDLTPFVLMDFKYCSSGGAFYKQSLVGDGITVFFDVKDGLQNWPMEIRITGKFFEMNSQTAAYLYETFLAQYDVRVSRIDFCLDIFDMFQSFEGIYPTKDDFIVKPFYYRAKMQHFHDAYMEYTGMRMGKNECVLRMYDKGKESGNLPQQCLSWWRFEVALRGDMLRRTFPEKVSYYDLSFSGARSVIKKEFEQRFECPMWFTEMMQQEQTIDYKREHVQRIENVQSQVNYRMKIMEKVLRELKVIGGVDKFNQAWHYLRGQYSNLFVEFENAI